MEMNERKSIKESMSMTYSVSMYRRKPIYAFIKRLFDIILSLTAILLLSWLFIILMIIIPFSVKASPLFGHKRYGKGGKIFRVWKFRSMVNDPRPIEEILTPEQLIEYRTEFKVTNDPRVTRFGKFLRKTSLDELPQLFNILIGNMSIVGWRPIIKDEVELYGDNKELLFKVKPGLTGYWASHGRSVIEYDKRIKMELYYCVKRSLWLDIRIIWHTALRTVFKSEEAK
ncbi:MAG: sugar transferase [Acholeplasmatales bacterium]|nr:sugar transferase [Acholeplasmatales bacterium]